MQMKFKPTLSPDAQVLVVRRVSVVVSDGHSSCTAARWLFQIQHYWEVENNEQTMQSPEPRVSQWSGVEWSGVAGVVRLL